MSDLSLYVIVKLKMPSKLAFNRHGTSLVKAILTWSPYRVSGTLPPNRIWWVLKITAELERNVRLSKVNLQLLNAQFLKGALPKRETKTSLRYK